MYKFEKDETSPTRVYAVRTSETGNPERVARIYDVGTAPKLEVPQPLPLDEIAQIIADFKKV